MVHCRATPAAGCRLASNPGQPNQHHADGRVATRKEQRRRGEQQQQPLRLEDQLRGLARPAPRPEGAAVEGSLAHRARPAAQEPELLDPLLVLVPVAEGALRATTSPSSGLWLSLHWVRTWC